MKNVAYSETKGRLWVFAAILVAFYMAGSALLPFVFGAIAAWLLRPLQARLTSLGLLPAISAGLITLSTTVAIGAIGLFLIPIVVQFVDGGISAAENAYPIIIQSLEKATGMAIEAPAQDVIDDVSDGDLEPLIEPATSATPLVVSLLGSAFNTVLFCLVTPVVLFFLLSDWTTISRGTARWLPRHVITELRRLWIISKDRSLQYIWGRLITVFWMAVTHILGLWLISFDQFLVVGTLAGLSVIVPIIGNIAVLIIAIAAAVLQTPEIGFVAAVVAVFAVAQVLEMVWIEPYFLGSTMNLHPFLVLFVLIVAGHLFGALGAIIALPIAAIVIGILESTEQLEGARDAK